MSDEQKIQLLEASLKLCQSELNKYRQIADDYKTLLDLSEQKANEYARQYEASARILFWVYVAIGATLTLTAILQ